MANAFIEQLQLRGRLSAEGLGQLQTATSRVQAVRAHRHVIQQQDPPSASFALLSGWACCYTLGANGSRQIIRLMMAGDFCELHADVSVKMDYAIAAVTDVEVAFIPALYDRHHLAKAPDIQAALYHTRVRDDAIGRAWLGRLAQRDSVRTLSSLLCEIYVRAGHSRQGGGEMFLPLTQGVLADATNMTTVHVNRMLRQLRERLGVTIQQGRLTITDFGTLASFAGFDATYLTTRFDTKPPR